MSLIFPNPKVAIIKNNKNNLMSGLTPNQSSKLVAKGRMKAIGVSWTEEEAVAIAKASPADREKLIAKLRGQVEKPTQTQNVNPKTPEEIAAEKEAAKAEKKAQADAKKAEAKAKKEAEAKAKKEGKGK